jgi:hypothetical protein
MLAQILDSFSVQKAIQHLACLIYCLCGLLLPVCKAQPASQDLQESIVLKKIPKRPRNAMTGTEFAKETTGMTNEERQAKAIEELRRGNVPDFLRNLKPVHLSCHTLSDETITAVIWVTPDYMAIGSDKDFLRIPLIYPSAVEVADAFDCILPTPKMVDEIYEQSSCHLKPDPLPPGPKMRSIGYYLKYRIKIRAQRKQRDCILGELVSGHKKDVVLTNRLNKKRNRIAIYGWHKENGEPIQPLSLVHGKNYADYSHGLRLIYKTVWINGEPRSIIDVLQDPHLAPVLTYEGFIDKLKKMLHLKPSRFP